MQFHVPQFIDLEDKIFGPLTFKQFVYLAGGAGLCVIIYVFVPYSVIKLPLIAAAAGLSVALAFYRINNKPFIYTLQAAVSYFMKSRLYIWKRQEHKGKSQQQIKKENEQIKTLVSQMSSDKTQGDRLKSKAFSVDVGESDRVEPKEPAHVSPNRSPS